MDANFLKQALSAHMQQFDRLNAHVKAMAERISRSEVSFWEGIQTSLLAFDQSKGLPFRPAVILLADSPAAGVGNDSFRVSSTEDFIVDQLVGTIALTAQASEPAVAAALGGIGGAGTGMGIQDRIYAKAANARVKLTNKDTKVPYFESEDAAGIPLSTICPAAGGSILTFKRGNAPTFIIPAQTQLQFDVALASTDAMFTTAATEYGIALIGAYVNRKYLGLSG